MLSPGKKQLQRGNNSFFPLSPLPVIIRPDHIRLLFAHFLDGILKHFPFGFIRVNILLR